MNNISLLITDTNRQITLSADTTFEVKEVGGRPDIHLTDVLYSIILDKLRSQDKATLSQGAYRVFLTASVVSLPLEEYTEEVSTVEE